MNIEEMTKTINQREPKKVFIQLPDGLKRKALEIADSLNKSGIETMISADPCYGACDLRIKEAEMAGCDLIAHVGHSKFLDTKIPVVYYEWPIDADVDMAKIKEIPEQKIALVTSIQHLASLEKIAEKLREAGKKPVIAGQILGCRTEKADKIADQVDAIVFIGSGSFHALALKKKVYRYDIEKNEITEITEEIIREEKKRQARIAKFNDSRNIGIVVSSKPGQFNMKLAKKLKKELEEKDKKALILIMDEVNENNLLSMGMDFYINTACPRIEISKMINACDYYENRRS